MYEYDVFISYSHAKDRFIASALQSVMQKLGKAWWQRRKLHVFRDETSLSATPELWATIEKALKASRYLIVLASPVAGRSEWVEKEVATWLAHRGPVEGMKTLLIALTDGELVWDKAACRFAAGAVTTLPPTLKARLAVEPLWIDLRDFREGFDRSSNSKKAFKARAGKLAAKVLGMPLEDLLSEEVRQQRRVLLLAGFAVISLLVLTVLAYIKANEAEINAVQTRKELLRANINLAKAHEERAWSLLSNADYSGSTLDYQKALLHALQAQRQEISGEIGLSHKVRIGLSSSSLARAFAPRWSSQDTRVSGDFVFSGEGSLLVAAVPKDRPNPVFQIWDILTKQVVRAVNLEGNDLTTTAAADDGAFDLMRLPAETRTYVEKASRDLGLDPMLNNNSIISSDARFLANVNSDGGARVWDLVTGKVMRNLNLDDYVNVKNITGSFVLSPAGSLLSVTAEYGNKVFLWDTTTGKIVRTLSPESIKAKMGPVSFSPDGHLLAVGGWDSDRERSFVQLWNPETGKVDQTLYKEDGEGRITAIAFSQDGSLLASSSGAGIPDMFDDVSSVTVSLWDLRKGKIKRSFKDYKSGVYFALGFSSDGRLLAGRSQTGHIQIWETDSGIPLKQDVEGHESSVNAVAFGSTDGAFASGDDDGYVWVWDKTKQKKGPGTVKFAPLFRPPKGTVTALAFSPDGYTLASGNFSGWLSVRLKWPG